MAFKSVEDLSGPIKQAKMRIRERRSVSPCGFDLFFPIIHKRLSTGLLRDLYAIRRIKNLHGYISSITLELNLNVLRKLQEKVK